MGLFDWLFGSANQSTGTTTTSVPSQFAPYISNILSSGQQVASRPYQPYPGQMLAPLNAQENQAISGIQGLQGQYSPYISQGQQMVSGAPTSFSPQDWRSSGTAASFMSPYTQNVTDVQKQEALRNAQIADVGLGGQAGQQGAFGGSRWGVEQGAENYNLQQMMDQIDATGLQNAYTQGQGQFNTQQQMGLGAAQFGNQAANASAQTLGGLGTAGQNLGITGQNANLAAGQVAQNQNQSALNLGYNQFQQQFNYPQNQLSWYSGLLNGTPVGSQTTGTTPTSSTGSNLLGLGIAGLGALGGGSSLFSGVSSLFG